MTPEAGRAAAARGRAAEDAAARAYEARGGVVLARRWRPGRSARDHDGRAGGEIDLVVRLGGILVFVEVKTGRAAARRDAIRAAQWSRLEAGALAYMLAHQTGDGPVRFDAAFVDADGAVRLVENARTSEAG